ncbi:MAG: hypothetical protein AABY22_34810, partial [Nanoarchaeota archaeon]
KKEKTWKCDYCGFYFFDSEKNKHLKKHYDTPGVSDLRVPGWVKVSNDLYVRPQIIKEKEKELVERGIIH